MRKNLFGLLLIIVATTGHAVAQDTYKDVYNEFKHHAQTEYEDFRKQANKEYVDWIRKAWGMA